MPHYSSAIRSKLPQAGMTIFTVMSALAREHNAINLSQGFPDFPVDEQLIELVTKRMREGFNQYAPMQGTLSLREVLAEKIELLYGVNVSPETEINITSGATQALYAAMTAMLHENDEVIVFTPAYDSYVPAIQLNQAKPVFVQLSPDDYSIPWEDVKKVINQRTKMILLNSPHNPTGAVLSEDDMQQLIKLVQGSDIIILSDEVYEHIIFDGQEHQSVLKYPELAERSFAVFSFGKTFHATGWKLGYAVAPENLMKEFRKVHQFEVFSANHPVQLALADYLKEPTSWNGISNFYESKRDKFLQLIKGSRFTFTPSAGTYFQLLNYEAISSEIDTELAERLTIENKIASIPVSVFYHQPIDNNVLRFCFAKEGETLERAAEVLCKI